MLVRAYIGVTGLTGDEEEGLPLCDCSSSSECSSTSGIGRPYTST